jgi:hypothetical protein
MSEGLLVLLADRAGVHIVIEVVPAGTASRTVERLARRRSSEVGIRLEIYATLATADAPRAFAKARRLLRFTDNVFTNVRNDSTANGNRLQVGRADL